MNQQPEETAADIQSSESTEPAESIVTMEPPPAGDRAIPSDTPSDEWARIALKPRVDSLNDEDLIDALKALVDSGAEKIALDFTQNRFVSVRVIKACMEAAAKVTDLGGSFVIVACLERTKRHFEVYGSLDDIAFVRSEKDLQSYKRPRFGLRGPRSQANS